jgi:uncharacterized coiled-coil protein SlyX
MPHHRAPPRAPATALEPATAESQISDLEIKLAFQDRLIGELDSLVRALGARLDVMERELAQVRDAIRSPEIPLGPLAERPPHY